MLGDKDWRFPGPLGPASAVLKLQEGRRRRQEVVMIPRPTAPLSSSQSTRREARRDYDWRQELAIYWDPRHHCAPSGSETIRSQTRAGYDGRQGLAISRHPRRQHHWDHPAPKLREGRQEEILMGDKDWRFPGTPGTTSSSKATRRETRGYPDGRQGLAISHDPRHYHSVPKLRDGRQEEIMMGDKHSRLPIYKKGDTTRL